MVLEYNRRRQENIADRAPAQRGSDRDKGSILCKKDGANMDKILVIDDSLLQAEAVRSLLKDDYEVTVCGTAEKGLEKARSGEYSLILLDVIMPHMSGFTLLKELQADASTKFIPVILITSLTDIMHEQEGLVLGAVDYITKPFEPLIVKARVNTHIRLFRYRMQFMKDAMIDELTGVANRRSYETNSIVRWREAIRLRLPFTVCMFDIDKFKKYNDTYGHPAGDHVIASVARTVSESLRRTTDFFARYGGEEFVAIFLGERDDPAFHFMQKIRAAVEALHIPHCAGISKWVTISIGGVTVNPREGDSYSEILKKADEMLYTAKEQGRNTVVWLSEKGQKWQEKQVGKKP